MVSHLPITPALLDCILAPFAGPFYCKSEDQMEIDREVLGDMIEARTAAAIQKYDQAIIIPREGAAQAANQATLDELMKKVGILWDHLQSAKGAWWMIGALGTAAVILANHFWK